MCEVETGANWKEHYFNTTQWSVVMRAVRSGPEAAAALEQVCQRYWYPLYSFARRKGNSPEDSKDLVQGFFEAVLSGGFLDQIDAAKGRFRTYLLVCMSNYMAQERERNNRLKRGGGRPVISIDAEDAESRYRFEPVDIASPEKLFERSWAQTLISRVADRLRMEYEKNGETDRFDHLKQFLMSRSGEASYRAVGETLGLSENGVKTCVRRLRLHFGDLMRAELRQTMDDPKEIDEEIRALLLALSS